VVVQKIFGLSEAAAVSPLSSAQCVRVTTLRLQAHDMSASFGTVGKLVIDTRR
jgi:hypothetical protein